MADVQLTDGSLLHLKIMTPSSIVYENDITTLTAPGEYGDIGVLPGHAALLSNLRIGLMDVILPDEEKIYFVLNKGFIEIAKDKITILTETAEDAQRIDLTRAQDSLKRAQNRIGGPSGDEELDKERAKDALMRAKVRIAAAKTSEKFLK